ncbi:MAG: WecB/TagA/CpsF family glycosyltransferase, partial [Verrucomicrobiota bacterium]|nr:WecB/TagA/CpsF family glycosyltransferase [Verrucomicrobiota bacterium]
LWTKLFFSRPLRRISGLAFLRAYLQEGGEGLQDSFWIMPDPRQSIENARWLQDEIGFAPEEESIYVAPRYERTGPIEDLVLLKRIKERNPSNVFIQLGGGVQERLGFFLRQSLSSRPAILCTGAALAFLSGEQADIPDWADRFYLGWLLRCFSSPEIFVPRYLKAFRLIPVLARNGRRLPEVNEPLARA